MPPPPPPPNSSPIIYNLHFLATSKLTLQLISTMQYAEGHLGDFGNIRSILPWARICKPFKESRNPFPAWRNRFLSSLNVYKHGLWTKDAVGEFTSVLASSLLLSINGRLTYVTYKIKKLKFITCTCCTATLQIFLNKISFKNFELKDSHIWHKNVWFSTSEIEIQTRNPDLHWLNPNPQFLPESFQP